MGWGRELRLPAKTRQRCRGEISPVAVQAGRSPVPLRHLAVRLKLLHQIDLFKFFPAVGIPRRSR